MYLANFRYTFLRTHGNLTYLQLINISKYIIIFIHLQYDVQYLIDIIEYLTIK